jgi:quercetin dioxygenase-like cupin family protein
MRSLTLLIATTFLFVGSSFAQPPIDTSKVIQVRNEPRHHDVLDNGWVRILDVRIPPGDTSLFHRHSTPSIFLVLGNTRTGSQTIVEPRHRTFSTEDLWYEDFTDTPRIHRVWNEDKILFHTIDIELTHKPGRLVDSPINLPSFTMLFDEKQVRGYRLTLAGGKGVRLNSPQAPVVVIGLSGPAVEANVNEKTFRERGDYLFLPAGTAMQFVNKGAGDVQFAVFELK